MRLDKVNFSGDMEIVQDDGTPIPKHGADFRTEVEIDTTTFLLPLDAIQLPCNTYDKLIEHDYPIAYPSGTYPTATAAFKACIYSNTDGFNATTIHENQSETKERSNKLKDCNHQLWIRGITRNANNEDGSTQDFTFPKQMVIPDSNGYYIYKEQAADQNLPLNEVNYFDNFNILWQVSKDGIDWLTVANSYNTIFVTSGENKSGSPWRFSEIANFTVAVGSSVRK